MFYSPLRYPGGKNRLSKFIAQICIDNNISGHYIEPYAGGASVALYLLLEKKVKKITINDYDRSIYAFWYCVLNKTKEFCDLIENTKINIENWKIQKQIQKQKKDIDLLSLGFSTFFLNRTNRSGIINAGAIGGIKQNGNYKINCRFNKKQLIERIKLIAKHKKNIKLYQKDALHLVDEIKKQSNNGNTIFYFDPPYFLQGATLYMNYYNKEQHQEMADKIKSINKIHWLVSYDDTSQIGKLYNWASSKKYSLTHFANKVKEGKEILFFSKNLKYPI